MQTLRMLPRDRYYQHDSSDPISSCFLPIVGGLYRRRIELCLEHLEPGVRVLEVGYGSGVAFKNLADLFTEVHGIDLHDAPDRVAGVFREEGLAVHLRSGSVLRLPYPDQHFDSVLCVSILEHLKPAELPVALAEIHRVLRPGRRFVYGVPVERGLMRVAFGVLGSFMGYDISDHHFSTEGDVATAAARQFHQEVRQPYRPFGGVLGSVYEIGVFRRSGAAAYAS